MPDAALGPVEYVVIRFDGTELSGDVLPALDELLDHGLIRMIDIAIVSKTADGEVGILESQELAPELAAAFLRLTGTPSGLLSEADLAELGETMDPATTAAAFLFEHVWATRFAAAVRGAGGELAFAERIPHAVVEEAQASLLAAAV